jgi:hypothetical protein
MAGSPNQSSQESNAVRVFSEWERERMDENDDSIFYSMPRLVYHADHSLLHRTNAAYKSLIPKGADVLDLMASWASNLDGIELHKVEGLGLNAEELR